MNFCARFSVLFILVISLLGCRGSCGKRGSSVPAPPPPAADVSAPDIMDTQTFGQGPDINPGCCPAGVGQCAEDPICSKQNREGGQPCRFAVPEAKFDVKAVCDKLNSCAPMTGCNAIVSREALIFRAEAANAFVQCILETDCPPAKDTNDYHVFGQLHETCIAKVMQQLPDIERAVCSKVVAKFKSCTKPEFKKLEQFDESCQMARLARLDVLKDYETCSEGSCEELNTCLSKAGCGTLRAD
ncbi:MAG: hypothetical protein CMH54_04265 [Myxococcales bacterium]|nr:hypothetical protein [Myxococcales bacterium]